ncbi:hypothetical protein [Glaciecola punicea]|jgi:hypothetical protein|uniref:hypothetical protein n=1 Tax=Glaciecola punicea TaxID=56804 RepID=UPI001495F0B4|nr:hypothetical protein [Glaciecola punicea]
MKELQDMTVEELEAKKEHILRSNAHWMSCQDGSYGAALHGAGYIKVTTELESRGVLT